MGRWWALVVCALIACRAESSSSEPEPRETADDVVDELSEEIEEVLVRVERVANDVRKRPPIASGDWRVPADLSYEPATPCSGRDCGPSALDESNTAVVHQEDLVELGTMGKPYLRLAGAEFVAHCATFLDEQAPSCEQCWDEPVKPSTVKRYFGFCRRLRYLVVIRTVELVQPTALRWTSDRIAFDGGELVAELHLYRLEPLEHLGARRVVAESSPRIKTRCPECGPADEDLQAQTRKALEEALARL
jgi:hypothetical protein